MFNRAIDSKLRGCDVVALKVEDISSAVAYRRRAKKASIHIAPSVRHKRRKTRPRKTQSSSRIGADAKAGEMTPTVTLPLDLYRREEITVQDCPQRLCLRSY
jgi:hypothetical protein